MSTQLFSGRAINTLQRVVAMTMEFDPEVFKNEQKVNVLRDVYRTYAELLYNLTQIDLRAFGGYITIQFVALGFVLSKIPCVKLPDFVGIAVMGAMVTVIALMFIKKNFERRYEAKIVMHRLNVSIGLKTKGFFIRNEKIYYSLSEKADNDEWGPDHRPWKDFYYIGIIIGFFCFLTVLISRLSFSCIALPNAGNYHRDIVYSNAKNQGRQAGATNDFQGRVM